MIIRLSVVIVVILVAIAVLVLTIKMKLGKYRKTETRIRGVEYVAKPKAIVEKVSI